jgi:hypothetical protein
MSISLVVGDVWRLTVNGSLSTNNFHVGLDFRVSALSGTPTTDNDLATYGDSTFGPLFRALMANSATYNSCRTRRLTPVVGRPIFQEVSTNAGNGTAGSIALARQVCGIGSFYTDLMGRAYRSRKYLPFPALNDDTDPGRPSAGYGVRLANFTIAYRTAAVVPHSGGGGSATMIPVVFHKKTLTTTDITSSIAQGQWGTQRRRGFYMPPRRRKHA